VIQIDQNTWYIKKELNSIAVENIYKKYLKNNNLDHPNPWTIDFNDCHNIDSSGLSLIIECIKISKLENRTLVIKNINNKAINLAKVYGVYEIINNYIKK
jgi:ABC-type transporter Mla MlaB component